MISLASHHGLLLEWIWLAFCYVCNLWLDLQFILEARNENVFQQLCVTSLLTVSSSSRL